MTRQVITIHSFEELHLIAASGCRDVSWRVQIENWRVTWAERSSLVYGRKPTRGPVPLTIDRQTTRVGQHYVRGQIFVGGSQGVHDPRAPHGHTGQEATGMNQSQ